MQFLGVTPLSRIVYSCLLSPSLFTPCAVSPVYLWLVSETGRSHFWAPLAVLMYLAIPTSEEWQYYVVLAFALGLVAWWAFAYRNGCCRGLCHKPAVPVAMEAR